jgi:hypothetical protein
VNGRPVGTSAEVYALVREQPPGTPVRYRLRRGEQIVETAIPSMRFGTRDFVLLFGAYLLNGAVFWAVGLGLWWRGLGRPAQLAAFALCILAGTFAITGADLYGPHWFYRVYVASEALLPAALLHLALVFPRDKLGGVRRPVLGLAYGAAAVLAVVYEAVHFTPDAFTLVRNLCAGSTGLAASGLVAALLVDYVTSAVGTARARPVIASIAASLALPALLFAASGASGGSISVSAAAFTALFFPPTLGFALGQLLPPPSATATKLFGTIGGS